MRKVNENIIVVRPCGAVVEMPWLNEAKAVVHGYLSGQAGAKAILDVLIGKVNPSGKLAETYPITYEDVSSAKHFPGKEVSVEYREGLYIGYRYYDTANVEVQFPDKAFRYFNVKTNKWEIESGSYTIYVGASSKDIRLIKQLEVEGTGAPLPYEGIEKQLAPYFSGQVKKVSLPTFETLLGHKAPSTKWDRNKPLGYNDTIAQMQYAKGWMARIAYHLVNISYKMFQKIGKHKIVNMYEMLILHLTFRGLSKMSCGAFSMEMIDGLLIAVNGNFFKGMYHLIKASQKRKVCEKYIQNKKK